MKEHRSASQILFGFLPEQTVDLQNAVWKVKEWDEPYSRSVDAESLRQELVRLASPWAQAAKDGNFVERLRQGYSVRLLALNREMGVKVERFPQVWTCKRCNRLAQGKLPAQCDCGHKRFGQLPFVGYHSECGALRAPYIPSCPQHKQVKVIFPGTSRAEELLFACPVCNKTLQKGFGFPKCDCGNGAWNFNVHRASSVYTPRTLVIINPPSTEKVKKVRDAGGPERALSWVLSGMDTRSFEEKGLTRESFKAGLLKQGIPDSVAQSMVEQAVKAGVISESDPPVDLSGEHLAEAESGAVSLALALLDSRLRLRDLISGTTEDSELGRKYRRRYPTALARAGLQEVEFIDSFPVLTGAYGYTRGDSGPGLSRLVPFKAKNGDFAVYGEIIQTEALLVRLGPESVARWLRGSGHELGDWADERSARLAILKSALVPPPGSDPTDTSAGAALLGLIHSFAHRFIRHLAVRSGIERSALAEFLVPQHCAFFVYAVSRGDFVLGGLQAVFETELDAFLAEFTNADPRCPLDPGCQRVSGACMACLHLGEPSCRCYNSFLNRSFLTGQGGYLRLTAPL